jgi:hypothetical protein
MLIATPQIALLTSLLAACMLCGCSKGPTEKTVDASRIYPYLVPESYLQYQPTDTPGLSKPIGHGIYIVLVEDQDGMVGNVTSDDLASLQLTAVQAHAKAIENLEALVKSGSVGMQRFPNGPQGKPFILFRGHWTAATCLLLPKLRALASKNLGTDDLCVSVPHRDAMLVFARGDRAYRDAMRAMIREKETDGAKPLTFEFFTLGENGTVPLDESE